MPRTPHDFAIDVLVRPRDGKTIHVARCLEPGCRWHTGELLERYAAVRAAKWHQIVEGL